MAGEKTLVPIGLAAIVVMLAIWLTRLDDKVAYQQQRIVNLEKGCRNKKFCPEIGEIDQ